MLDTDYCECGCSYEGDCFTYTRVHALGRSRYLSGGFDLSDVVHDVEGKVVGAAAVAGGPGRVPAVAEDPGGAAHGEGRYGLAPVAAAASK